MPGIATAEEERDRDQGSELADSPDGRDRPAEGRVQFAFVAEDRQKRPESRGAQCDADDDGLFAGCDQPAGEHTGREADEPSPDRATPRAAPEGTELDLGARDEEQHREPELRQDADERGLVRPSQHGGADDDAEDELEHHDRHAHPATERAGEIGARTARIEDQDDRQVLLGSRDQASERRP